MTRPNTFVLPPRPRTIAYRLVVLTALGGLLFVGCGRHAAPAVGNAAENPVKNAADKLTLTTIDSHGLAKAIERRRGKVVLVEFWATWCIPCVKLFPHTVELHRRLADRGLSVISVSMDDTEKQQSVLHFLRDHQATFENFIGRYGVGSEGFDAFRISDGALPHVKLYDRHGRLQKTFASGGESLAAEKIEAAVDELLKQ
jgi:thiol-disulfide isomerase/thioredoxin